MRFYAGFGDGWWACFVAALGDAAMLALLYALMACAAERWLWFDRLSFWRTILLVSLGILVAAVVEFHALAAGKWSYDDRMPRVPFLGIGWSPVLQMTLIPLALAWASRRWAGAHATGPAPIARPGGVRQE
jgi:hypothetical protein